MSITTWAALKVDPVSRKMAVVKVVPKELLDVVWTDLGDFAIVLQTLDTCDATTGWGITGGLLSVNGVTFKEGTGSLNIYGMVAGSNIERTKTVTSFDGTNQDLYVWVYIADPADFAANGIRIKIYSTAGNFYYDDLVAADMAVGWNLIGGLISGFSTSGTPVITALTIIELTAGMGVGKSTLEGEFMMDYWRLSRNSVTKYSTPLDTYHGSDIQDIEKDGTVMTRAASSAALETTPLNEFYYDITAETLYINIDIDTNPYDSDYVCNHLFYFSNDSTFRIQIPTSIATIIPEPRIESVPIIKHSNKGATFGLNLPAKASMKLNANDGNLDVWYRTLEWTDADVTVYLGGESLPWTEYQILYTGRIVDDIEWARDSLMIKIEDRRNRALQINQWRQFDVATNKFNDTFIGMDHNARNKAAPKLYGRRVDMVRLLGLNIGYFLVEDMDASQTYFMHSKDRQDAITETLASGLGTVIIGGEKMNVTSGVLGRSNCTRGYNNTAAAAHPAGAPITWVYTHTGSNYLYFGHFDSNVAPTPGQLYIDEKPFTGGTYLGSNAYRLSLTNSAPEVEDGTTVSADALMASGSLIGSMMQDFLNDMGIPDAELDVASFTALDTAILNSQPGIFMDSDSKGADILNIMLQTAQAWIVTDGDGKLEARRFSPVIVDSTLVDLTSADIESWKPRWDSKRIRTKATVLYSRKFALSGDKEWTATTSTNYLDGIVPVQEDKVELETAEYNPIYAAELRDHLLMVTMLKQERVDLSVLLLEFIEKRPGDRIRVTLDRPWNSVAKIFEIDAVTIAIKNRGVDIGLSVHNLFGLDDKVGGWVSDGTAATWATATDAEKTEQGFWCDDNGFIDATDATTKNRKVWY